MIFVTKEYFLNRMTGEDMATLQQLVDLMEDWRQCKRLVYRHKAEELKELSRTCRKGFAQTSVMKASKRQQQANIDSLLKLIKDQLRYESVLLQTEDPYGTREIKSLENFCP